MNKEELKEKICEISNSEFPLIDFFNDIDWLDDRHFNTEKAYEDIEKIYNVFVYYKDKVKKIEKELKQTKLNFKNSQIHSKNCYKKLKGKYTRLERAIKILKIELSIHCYEKVNIHNQKEYWLSYEELDGYCATYTISKEDYELLKEVFESVGGKCE